MLYITAVVSSFIVKETTLLNYTWHFIGKPISLYDETNPDWAPSVKMGHEKLTSPDMQQKRHKRVEKREVKKQASTAAQSVLLLQHVDDEASSANPEEDLTNCSEPIVSFDWESSHLNDISPWWVHDTIVLRKEHPCIDIVYKYHKLVKYLQKCQCFIRFYK